MAESLRSDGSKGSASPGDVGEQTTDSRDGSSVGGNEAGGSSVGQFSAVNSWGIAGFNELGYALVEWIGPGTWGRARRKADGVEVAVKTYQNVKGAAGEAFRTRVRSEYNLLASLNHSCVIRAEVLYETKFDLWLCVEWWGLSTVMECVEARGALSCSSARRLVSQLLQGLAHLHAHRVVHGALGANKLRLAADARMLKITDFSRATCSDDQADGEAFSSENSAHRDMALPETCKPWAAPEVINGYAWDEAGDVWACGVCVYYMSFGRMPVVVRHADLDASPSCVAVDAFEDTSGGGQDGLRCVVLACLVHEPLGRSSSAALSEVLGP